MSSDTKPTKPMPSAAEINAYLEVSAARTRMRLPLAKGAIVVPPKPADAAPSAGATPSAGAGRAVPSRALPLQSRKELQGSKQPQAPEKPAAPAGVEPGAQPNEPAEWRPFAADDES